jgi:D-alanyl-D-alanine carboxypeptidase
VVDGIAGVTARIAQIQARIAEVSASPVSFETVLGEAVLATTGTSSASGWSGLYGAAQLGLGSVAAVGSGKDRVDPKGVPLELQGYGNGKIPAAALSQVAGTSHSLWEPAARSLEALMSAAQADGVTIGITDSYRTYDTQVDLVRRKGLYSQGGLAASPGTSMHGWGVAVDLKLDASAQAWMRQNAGRFGFEETLSREPWHWQYIPTH